MTNASANDMVLFARVVRAGSFTSAAKTMGLTKQSVSERLSKLEGQLGVRLLDRTTRTMRLTDLGARYFERCVVIAQQIDEANSELLGRQAEPAGRLRVSAPFLYGRRFLGPIVSRYLLRYPRTRVEILLEDRRTNLIEEGVDVAIRVGALEDSSLRAHRMGEAQVVYAISSKLLAKSGRKARSLAFKEALHAFGGVGMRSIESWSLGKERMRVEPKLVVNDLEMATDAAGLGLGIGRLPVLVCREAVLARSLTVLWGKEGAASMPIHALYPSSRYVQPAVRAFVDMLAASPAIEPLPDSFLV